MSIRRVMPDIRSEAMEESRDFYGLLGFEEVMNHGWVMTLASPSNPTAQVSFMSHDKTAPVVPDMSVEVDDVDAAYAVMRESGAEVVHPLQDEEWGVRRFFVRDPNGLWRPGRAAVVARDRRQDAAPHRVGHTKAPARSGG